MGEHSSRLNHPEDWKQGRLESTEGRRNLMWPKWVVWYKVEEARKEPDCGGQGVGT